MTHDEYRARIIGRTVVSVHIKEGNEVVLVLDDHSLITYVDTINIEVM